MSLSQPPKALLTDVFGTVVDWRSTVTNFLTSTAHDTLNSPTSSLPSTTRTAASTVSWPDFAWQWRKSYYKFTSTYNPATDTFKSVDQHHLESLISLLREHGLETLWSEEELQRISMIWHFLDPWPDSSNGLKLLNQKFETCTLSNGNTSLLSDLAAHGPLPYKHIFSAEDFQAYKPNPAVYNGAAAKLGLETKQCALIAAHLGDLQAARGCGYQTIYIERKEEETWDKQKIEDARREGWVDMWIGLEDGGLEEVARRFGCTGQDGAGGTDPQKGIYYETGGITGTDRHGEGSRKEGSKSTAQQPKDGVYHEDADILSSKTIRVSTAPAYSASTGDAN